MAIDKKSPDDYPKMGEKDTRLKEQEEFDSAGRQRQSEDEDKNESIAQAGKSSSDSEEQTKNDA